MDENLYVCLRFGGAVCVYVCVYVCAVLYDYEHAQVHSSLRIHMYMGACFLAAGVNNRSSTCARTHTHTRTRTQGEKPLEFEVELVRALNTGPFTLEGQQGSSTSVSHVG